MSALDANAQSHSQNLLLHVNLQLIPLTASCITNGRNERASAIRIGNHGIVISVPEQHLAVHHPGSLCDRAIAAVLRRIHVQRRDQEEHVSRRRPRACDFRIPEAHSVVPSRHRNTLQPRDFTSEVVNDQALDSKTKGRIVRAEAAQANGFENLGFFSAAVVAATFAGLSPWTVNSLSLGYLVSRFVYNHIYIFNDLVPVQARTAAYFGGIGMIIALFIQAGNNLKSTLL